MLQFVKMIYDQRGATAIEYGLIAALIAVAAIVKPLSVGFRLVSLGLPLLLLGILQAPCHTKRSAEQRAR